MTTTSTTSTSEARGSITVTPKAVEMIKKQIQKRGAPNTALRLGIRGGGCAGFSYVIEFHDGEPHARDVVYDLTATDGSPVRVLVDKKSHLLPGEAERARVWGRDLVQRLVTR